MQIEPSGACEILSTSTKGTFDKSKNTITYTSAGTDTSEVIMKCILRMCRWINTQVHRT